MKADEGGRELFSGIHFGWTIGLLRRLKFAGFLTNTFEPIQINIHQLMSFQQRLYLRPDAGEQGVKIIPAKIAESQMHHLRRRRTRDNPV
jgi:hypothetical protein